MDMISSIAQLSTNMAQMQAVSDVSMAVLDMALEDFSGEGAMMADMMQNLSVHDVNPAIGGNIDIAI